MVYIGAIPTPFILSSTTFAFVISNVPVILDLVEDSLKLAQNVKESIIDDTYNNSVKCRQHFLKSNV